MEELRYVYAVCRPLDAPLAADLTGIGGEPPRQLAHEGLVAVVGPVPERDFAEEPLRRHLEDLDWLSDTARAHQRVIAALTSVTCPLPLRLGTVFRDDSGVRAMLQEGAERFRRVLGRIDGCVEWGVKVHLESEEPARDRSTGTPAQDKPLSGRDYLRQRRSRRTAQEEGRQRAEAFAQSLHEKLSERADDSRLHAPQDSALSKAPGVNILNAAYLVSRAHSEEFVELVDHTKDEEHDSPGLRVELTGPWAAYSFTADDPEPGAQGTERSR
ncbi:MULTISPECIES: GvpL/GvpF family gas vesicle protein [Streptomyces]|uniref:GvpL/GvpF family gas vesicle protein n=1 Tax=Streptomyces TaxID=1883 RepID=UPI001E3D29CB|nr:MULTISPECIES: GvpL/GvpF family gas vesicle protein [Streptomyces]UFQ20441.1 GvpL/GvpF family gas vesicle protein [Streptomyces huasconensis]WCL90049.1 GvpL/GvpF family gas vesicle protein [Streptomyces sp. JCM 35825]